MNDFKLYCDEMGHTIVTEVIEVALEYITRNINYGISCKMMINSKIHKVRSKGRGKGKSHCLFLCRYVNKCLVFGNKKISRGYISTYLAPH